MKRLVKPLALVLTALMVILLFPVTAKAATGFAVDQNGLVVPSDADGRTVHFEFYLTYNGVRITDLPAGISGLSVTPQRHPTVICSVQLLPPLRKRFLPAVCFLFPSTQTQMLLMEPTIPGLSQ